MVASEELIKNIKKSFYGIPGEKISGEYGSKDIAKALADQFKEKLDSKELNLYCPDCGTKITDFDETYKYLVCDKCGSKFIPIDLVNFNKEM